jgi:hypothetical protein
MRGYCPRCREYRGDNGTDAWSIVWKNGIALCKRCGSAIDLWNHNGDSVGKYETSRKPVLHSRKRKRSRRRAV